MKALLSRQAGGPESLVLEDLPEVAPGPGQVKIAVRACGINYPDLLIIQDLYQTKPPRPFIPGAEIAGVVEAVGEKVDKVRPGDRVLMSPVSGGMAEKAIGPATNCWKIPDAMPFDEAAALLLTYGTSQHALQDRAQLRAGETLLVLGASGGVGLAAVELGKAIGARAIAAPTRECNIRQGRSTRSRHARSPIDSSPPVERRARTWFTTRSAATIRKPRCAPSVGRGGISWSDSPPAFRSCRST
jgi:NADPH2:quinone reductase